MSVLGPRDRAALRRHLARTADEAARSGEALLASFHRRVSVDLDPLALFAAASGVLPSSSPRFFFDAPGRTRTLVAAGEAAAIEAAGPRRFELAAAAARALFGRLRSDGPAAAAPAGAILVGGFAFADAPSRADVWRGFPPLRFRLPSLAAARDDRGWTLALAARIAPGADPEPVAAALEDGLARWLETPTPIGDDAPEAFVAHTEKPRADYRRLVTRALRAIAEGSLEKVVIARTCALRQEGGFDPVRVLASLRAAHPGCFAFAVGQGEATFLGATPERLLRRAGERLLASALAGSAPRGRTPEEDEALGRALRESKKDQSEHAVVVRSIRSALAGACGDLEAPESPQLLRLDGIQHLHTPVSGRLLAESPADALTLAGRLHPTPAVGGAPRAAAQAWLRAHEGLERGWWAGGVGWLAPDGDGELAVALRSALLRGDAATLWAGAGVVQGSLPEAELRETGLKLRAALSALVEL